MPQRFTILQPDDLHLHLRDGAILSSVVAESARHMARAVIMPNLSPPISTTAAALAYRQRILDALPPGSAFQPLMTLYLTEDTSAEEIARAKATGAVVGVKLYPAGATTNAQYGVTALRTVTPVLEALEKTGMPLLMHGEVTDPATDIFDRERFFIDQVLIPLMRDFPALKLVFEHITTSEAVDFVRESEPRLVATITAHHLLYNRNALFLGGIRPHHYCLPVLKREHHRLKLLSAATSGSTKFFAGTDSAPHVQAKKESGCGCAGIFTASHAVALYAEGFDAHIDLRNPASQSLFQGFMSQHGARFYGLPENTRTIRLTRRDVPVPKAISTPVGDIIPLRAGGAVAWKVDFEREIL